MSIALIAYALCVCRYVDATGLGAIALLKEDTRVDVDDTDLKDLMFERGSKSAESPVDEELEAEFEAMIKHKMQIQVVAPNKELIKAMNFISTKSRTMFLREYEKYFQNLHIGTTSRPMLLAYLGLELSTGEQIAAWTSSSEALGGGTSSRAATIKRRLSEGCKRLLQTRQNSFELHASDVELIQRMKSYESNKFRVAYEVFENNLNLFMMDTYLTMCAKILPDDLRDDLSATTLSF